MRKFKTNIYTLNWFFFSLNFLFIYRWYRFLRERSLHKNFNSSIWNHRGFLYLNLLWSVYLEILAVHLKVSFDLLTVSVLILEIKGEGAWTLGDTTRPPPVKPLYSALGKWTKGYYLKQSITEILINELVLSRFFF